MKEINFSEFRIKCSAILQQVGKTRQPIRVTRLGEALAEIVPLSEANNAPGAKRLLKKSPSASKARRGR
jgi:antitoxin (DNA-binding transcriptional repressor) of toxin-antitoxin stability system